MVEKYHCRWQARNLRSFEKDQLIVKYSTFGAGE